MSNFTNVFYFADNCIYNFTPSACEFFLDVRFGLWKCQRQDCENIWAGLISGSEARMNARPSWGGEGKGEACILLCTRISLRLRLRSRLNDSKGVSEKTALVLGSEGG